jgi:hypothetical protein
MKILDTTVLGEEINRYIVNYLYKKVSSRSWESQSCIDRTEELNSINNLNEIGEGSKL